jgi:amino acid adenylation domain-containing protein
VRPVLLHHLLERSAGSHPDRTAVADGGGSLSYAELNRQAARLAGLLRELGVAPGDRVGLFLDKSVHAVTGMYGALKAGAAYVPLDPQAPPVRLGYIAGDCGIEVLLTASRQAGRWSALAAAGAPLRSLVVLDAEGPAPAGPPGVKVVTASALPDGGDAVPAPRSIDEDAAYILYTSGSTGTPKGVTLSHGNALTFVQWAAEVVAVSPEDRLSNHAPLHFDLSVFDIFAAAAGGASVHLLPSEAAAFPAEMARFIAGRRITVWYSVPSALTLLVTRGALRRGDLPSLRTVIFAGEVFPTKHLRRLMDLLPEADFYNWYGPTETNVCTSYRVPAIPPDQAEPIPIGRAIADTEVFAVTEGGRRARPGEEGELHVRGGGVMKGYWGMPGLTSEVLVPDPLGRGPGPVYRTGDLVREDPDGNYRFVGRRDAQIKSRGYRIELGEIEHALLGHPAVVECAVAAVPDELVTNRIKAFVALRQEVDQGELVRFLAARIPRYMVPEAFEFLDVLPKTSTGKIDRRALADA